MLMFICTIFVLLTNNFSNCSEQKPLDAAASERIYDQRRPEDVIALVLDIENFEPGSNIRMDGTDGQFEMPADTLREALRKSPDLRKKMLRSNNSN